MSVLATAIALASKLHESQTDKGGKPYILHPLRIMMRLRTNDEELMAIAVLHDVVEDCSITFDDLRELGMTQRVIDGVDLLTKRPGFTYFQFIERLAGNRDALLVKREDLRDNSDLTRLKGITEKDLKRMDKYIKAFRRVEELLRVLDGHTSNE